MPSSPATLRMHPCNTYGHMSNACYMAAQQACSRSSCRVLSKAMLTDDNTTLVLHAIYQKKPVHHCLPNSLLVCIFQPVVISLNSDDDFVEVDMHLDVCLVHARNFRFNFKCCLQLQTAGCVRYTCAGVQRLGLQRLMAVTSVTSRRMSRPLRVACTSREGFRNGVKATPDPP